MMSGSHPDELMVYVWLESQFKSVFGGRMLTEIAVAESGRRSNNQAASGTVSASAIKAEAGYFKAEPNH